MTRKQKKMLVRIIVSFIILVGDMVLFHFWKDALQTARLMSFAVPYLIIGYDIVRKAVINIFHGQVFDENFLMTVATLGAFATGEYAEASAVMLFYQVGELFQSYAVNKSRRSVAELMDIRPDHANVENDEGELVEADPETVKTGDTIVVKAGERIPLDGVVMRGTSAADTSALTGESVPRDISEGDEVISGCINLTGTIWVRVTKEYGQSTVSRILELVENASEKKSKSENFITKFSRIYTPAVVIGAVLLAVIPPIITGGDFIEWLKRAMTFLVISCPCALVISIPLSFFCGIGGASKQGILIKGGCFMETLANAGIMVFDKTGTLTKGSFEVTAVHPQKCEKEELTELAAHAECYSDHPISHSLKRAWGKDLDMSRVGDVREKAGHGVKAVIDGREVLAGNMKLMESENISCAHECHKSGTAVHIARDGEYMGHMIISDEPKKGAKDAISQLKKLGVGRIVMLTGDSRGAGEYTAKELGIDECRCELLPADKVACVEELLNSKEKGQSLVFTGDGINDAPVLTRADVGIAMGALGSDAAIEAADIVLMDDDPGKIAAALEISRKTLSIVKQNIVFALGVKALVLVLGALGLANMWAAVFADVGVSVIAILNAMRAMNSGNSR